jgi:hypothetical protein
MVQLEVAFLRFLAITGAGAEDACTLAGEGDLGRFSRNGEDSGAT